MMKLLTTAAIALGVGILLVPGIAVSAADQIVFMSADWAALACEAWNEDEMDALLLLQPVTDAYGYDGPGDFAMDPVGRLRRRREREIAPFVFAGVQVLHPRLFEAAPEGAFSLNLLYDRAIESERLWGLRHDGRWFHEGTPEAILGKAF